MMTNIFKKIGCFTLGLMFVGTAIAGSGDCSVSGGGNFESDEGVLGPTRTGGHIIAKYGPRFDGCESDNASGVWMINLADGTRFQATDVDGLSSVSAGSINYSLANGQGVYEGEMVSFAFLFEDSLSSLFRDRITFELYDEDNQVVTRAAGYLERGSIRVDLGD